MPNNHPFLVYKSSAGSGKTYTIAKEYLKLALSDAFYFRYILAVTFTNKAADEMKDRVLTFLTDFANGKSSPLMIELTEHLHCDQKAIQRKAEEVLRNILHDYSNFSITTIDTFFNQVIRTFTREIGLQGGFEIEMDLDDVLVEIIDKMLASLHEDEELKKWLVDFAMERLKEGKSYEFREEIKGLAKQLFQEQYKALESKLTGTEVDRSSLKKLADLLNQKIKEFENSLTEIGEKGLSIIEANGLTIHDFANGKSGVANQFNKWKIGDFSEPGKRVLDAMEDVGKWFSKKSPLKDQIEALADQQLLPLLQKGYAYFQAERKSFQTASEVNKYLYTFGLLNDLTTKIREYREEHEVILISDLPQFLRKIIDDSDTPYIYEKMGNRYHHILIDEFQDTSTFQWDNFKPLVNNSLASGNFNMIVGDVKQSIYRWRGGNSDLLLNQVSQDVGEGQIQEKFLSTNYRSHEQVINFNNGLFQVTPLLLRDFLAAEIGETADKSLESAMQRRLEFVAQSYEGVAQDEPEHIKKEGFVQLSFTDKPKRGADHSWDDLAVQWAIKQVEILQQNGNQLKDIAILVRDSGQENKLVQAFGQYKHAEEALPNCLYEVISAQAMYLTNASVVNFMIAVFKYLNNQKEQIALAEVVHEYQRNILQNKVDLNELFTKNLNEYLPDGFVKYVHVLGRFPIYELTEILIRLFELHQKEGELAYLQAFQDAILEYSKNEKGDLGSFLKWWDQKGKRRTVQFSENLDAIKILTIHKSKGLQYKHVLVPFCNWNMDHNAIFSNILWTKSLSQKPYDLLEAVPLRYSSALGISLFSEQFFDEKIKAHSDNLNLLYVAFTRAEQNLLIHAQAPSKSRKAGKIGLISDLIWDYSHTLPDFDEETKVYEQGKLVENHQGTEDDKGLDEVYLQTYQSSKWRNKLMVKKQAGDYFDFGETTKELKVNLGTLAHQILSEIKHKDELKACIDATYMRMQITSSDADKLMSKIQQLFENEVIESWYSGKYEVRNEVVVLPKDGQIKRLDRVLLEGEKAIIIDFKTGKPKNMDKNQVIGYAHLLEEMDYKEVSGYLVYLEGPQILQVK